MFPVQDEWNRPIEQDPVDYRSNCYVQNSANAMTTTNVHLDLG